MYRDTLVLLLLIGLANPWRVDAYDLNTHERMSQEAVAASTLEQYLASELRLDWTSQYTIGRDTRSADQWVGEGAKGEDLWEKVAFHFYNPIDDTGIGVLFPSPSWALEDPSLIGAQSFSFKDARERFYDGLTLSEPVLRERSLARMFETVGHVVHHLQDMAQPQHTRNDWHAGLLYLPLLGEPSYYEHFTEVRYKNLLYTGYQPVYRDEDTTTFNEFRKFWHTVESTVPSRKGIADFSNREFVSAGSNFSGTSLGILSNPAFSLPAGSEASPETTDIQTLFAEDGTISGLSGSIDIIRTPVFDGYTDATYNARRTSSYGIFDHEIDVNNELNEIDFIHPRFTLNRFNFRDAHELLIPRAVGYSAGLINYFFRGRIDMLPNPIVEGGYVIQNLGTEQMHGTFTLLYDGTDGNRYQVPGAQWEDITISPGGDVWVNGVESPSDPPARLGSSLLLVFRGDMGEETDDDGSTGAVAAKVLPSQQFLIIAQKTCGATCPNGGFGCPYIEYTGTYRSQLLDQGWERIGDGPRPLWLEWSSNHFRVGDYVREDLLFLGSGFVWASRDGGDYFAGHRLFGLFRRHREFHSLAQKHFLVSA